MKHNNKVSFDLKEWIVCEVCKRLCVCFCVYSVAHQHIAFKHPDCVPSEKQEFSSSTDWHCVGSY